MEVEETEVEAEAEAEADMEMEAGETGKTLLRPQTRALEESVERVAQMEPAAQTETAEQTEEKGLGPAG